MEKSIEKLKLLAYFQKSFVQRMTRSHLGVILKCRNTEKCAN